jgi:hypothetical protein
MCALVIVSTAAVAVPPKLDMPRAAPRPPTDAQLAAKLNDLAGAAAEAARAAAAARERASITDTDPESGHGRIDGLVTDPLVQVYVQRKLRYLRAREDLLAAQNAAHRLTLREMQDEMAAKDQEVAGLRATLHQLREASHIIDPDPDSANARVTLPPEAKVANAVAVTDEYIEAKARYLGQLALASAIRERLARLQKEPPGK